MANGSSYPAVKVFFLKRQWELTKVSQTGTEQAHIRLKVCRHRKLSFRLTRAVDRCCPSVESKTEAVVVQTMPLQEQVPTVLPKWSEGDSGVTLVFFRMSSKL
jgi:hypothetical protein